MKLMFTLQADVYRMWFKVTLACGKKQVAAIMTDEIKLQQGIYMLTEENELTLKCTLKQGFSRHFVIPPFLCSRVNLKKVDGPRAEPSWGTRG